MSHYGHLNIISNRNKFVRFFEYQIGIFFSPSSSLKVIGYRMLYWGQGMLTNTQATYVTLTSPSRPSYMNKLFLVPTVTDWYDISGPRRNYVALNSG